MDILPFYSIHLISAVQGAFGTGVTSLQKLPCPNGVEVRACYGDGTRVLMHLGPDAPVPMHMTYSARTGCRLIDAGDNYPMFMAAAEALDRMIAEWKSPVSGEEITEAARMADFVVNAGVGQAAEIK
jgi:hypothetical protein